MPKARSENRNKAHEIWQDSEGKMMLKDIATALGVSDTQIRKWKSQDHWDDKNKVTLPNTKGNVTKQKKPHGAPKGNKNAKGNRGGKGAPEGNNFAVAHGFFAKIFPDDPETLDIIKEIQGKKPLEILWEQIVIQYTAIARAQKIMWVKDKDEMIKELKRSYKKTSGRTTEKTSSNSEECEYEYEFQFAWDRQATFLNAQSRAISTLENLIVKYEKLLLKGMDIEEQQLRIDTMKAQLDKIKNPGDIDIQKYLDALNQTAEDVWKDENVEDAAPAENGAGEE